MDFNSMVLGPLHAVFGVDASLVTAGGAAHALTAIDRTRGIEVTEGAIGVASVRPAAGVRAADLVTLGIDLDDLDGGSITLNGATWSIDYHIERPTPFGAEDGQVFLILTAGAA